MEKSLSIEEMLALAEKVENWTPSRKGKTDGYSSVGIGNIEELEIRLSLWRPFLFGDKYGIEVMVNKILIGCNYTPNSKKIKSIYESAEKKYKERLRQTKERGIEYARRLLTN